MGDVTRQRVNLDEINVATESNDLVSDIALNQGVNVLV